MRYELYLGGHKDELAQIELAKSTAIGIKIFLGQSTGSLLMDDEVAFEELCRLAAEHDMVVAVHAEDDATIHENIKTLKHENSDAVALHSKIRSREAAMRALEKALRVGKKHKTRLYILHASTAEEVAMVRQAKKAGQHVFLETTPHHLFLTENDYAAWGTKVQMNPPLRTTHDQTALWAGIKDGTIDTVGTDHAPHTLAEKAQPYGTAPSGVPGIETLLPLLLTAARDGRLTLDDVVRVTRTNAEHIFRLAPNDDIVLVDIQKERPVRDEALKTKCGWSPFVGRVLTGWPVYTILKGKVYRI
ncbi:MAG: amidohydrolase family protein [Candidatus Magasanikbacteria bacterium]|nr:amidohydrolase family protein [Candidatus Magasanikbacteria bacterium]